MASFRRSVVSSILFTVFGGPGILLGLLPWWMTRFHIEANAPYWSAGTGAALILAGIMPLLESIVRFVVKGRGTLVPAVPTELLVVSGLYRFVRNPMYLGVLTALAGEALLFWSRGVAIELAIVCTCMHLFVLAYEEPKLRSTFGEEYRRYCARVPRWFPRLTAYHA